MSEINAIAEILAIDQGTAAIRVPDQQQVPLTPRIKALIDTPQFQRLRHISQLGLVSLVYPGATHSRFEHSLGVYRMGLLFLKHFALDEQFSSIVSQRDAKLFIVSSLLHDLAHWPYCHPIEDLALDSIKHHEELFCNVVNNSSIPQLLRTEWGINVEEVSNLLCGRTESDSHRILYSMLSGPIDVDKMDYLFRDSLHAGVPYGENFDRQRLISSLCLDENADRISITDKGRTAAELMVFARYVMFSEVYWHHAVRSATAMVQRAFYLLHDFLPMNEVFNSTDKTWFDVLSKVATLNQEYSAIKLLNGVFGTQRTLFKRLGQFSCFENEEVYRGLARRPYAWLVRCSEHLANLFSTFSGNRLTPADVLIDAPPVGLEVQFNIQVRLATDKYKPLGSLSPVVNALATNQFDDYVKRVRVFVSPELSNLDQIRPQLNSLLLEAINLTGP